jgi:hypothetical protein
MERKRKMQRTGTEESSMRFYVGSSSQGHVFRPGQLIRNSSVIDSMP